MRLTDIAQRTDLKVIATVLLHYKQVRSKVVFSMDIVISPSLYASRARSLNECKITFEILFNYILKSHGREPVSEHRMPYSLCNYFSLLPNLKVTYFEKTNSQLFCSDPFTICTPVPLLCYLSLTFDLWTCVCSSPAYPCHLAQPPPPCLCVPSLLHRLGTRFWRSTAAASSASHTMKLSESWNHHGTWWWRWKT